MGNTLPKNAKTIQALPVPASRTAYTIEGAKGLRLVAHPTGKRVWYAVYQLGKGASRKKRWREIGQYSADGWTLAKAIEEAKGIIGDVSVNGDRPPADCTTFGQLFQAWLDEHAKKKLDTWEDEERRYRLHLEKPLGLRPASEIERKDIREIRDTVSENAGPIQSNRTLALFNRVMNWAVDEDRAKFNPAARLKKVGEESRRERILSNDELRRLWSELSSPLEIDSEKGGLTETDREAAVAVRRAIKLLMVTGQRRGEVIGITKSELEDDWWTIPKERTKNGLPHRVPLTATAQAILIEAIDASGDSPYVFPSGKTEGAIRPDAVTKQLQRMCRRMNPKIEGLGPHDIRRTIGTAMRKLGISVEDRSHVLNHVSGAKSKVTSWHYDTGEHDVEKRAALEKWDRELLHAVGLPARNNIFQIRA